MSEQTDSNLSPLPLPASVTQRWVQTDTGLNQHVLEAGDPANRLIMLMHGFPEIAFSWRYVLPALAEAGYWVVAPDLRGVGRTTGWQTGYDVDLEPFSLSYLVRDNVALIRALGRDDVHAMIGHDFGSSVTAWTALVRPDLVGRAMMMSSPFSGAPAIARGHDPVHDDLAALARPRKHYQWYYCTRPANADMMEAAQGLHAFLRGYYHMKSADWAGNAPHTLTGWTAEELAKMPTYYVMDAGETMAETVTHEMPSADEIAACQWLSEDDLAVYTAEYGRTGFQGGLNWYRGRIESRMQDLLSIQNGMKIHVPTAFVSGRQDWGWAQFPGALEALETKITTDYRGTRLIDGAGHWVQQEQPEAVIEQILEFVA